MNTELLKSKKFRAAILAAVGSLLTFLVTKLGLNWDPNEILTLIGVLSAPFLIYIGAEGFSEADAKRVIEENKIRKELSDQVLNMVQQPTDQPK